MSDLRAALEIMGEFRSGIHPLEIDHGLRLGDPYVAFRRRGYAATWSRFRALRPVPILPLTHANVELAQQGNHLQIHLCGEIRPILQAHLPLEKAVVY